MAQGRWRLRRDALGVRSMTAERWVVVYARGNERNVAPASCKADAFAAAHAYRRDGWTAWAELRSRWSA